MNVAIVVPVVQPSYVFILTFAPLHCINPDTIAFTLDDGLAGLGLSANAGLPEHEAGIVEVVVVVLLVLVDVVVEVVVLDVVDARASTTSALVDIMKLDGKLASVAFSSKPYVPNAVNELVTNVHVVMFGFVQSTEFENELELGDFSSHW
jgi:hypothetical protein